MPAGSPDFIQYKELAMAIVKQAVKDYIDVLIKLLGKKLSPDKKKELVLEKKELEDFFYSDWYELLCSIDPDYLIRHSKQKAIDKYVEKEMKKKGNVKSNA